MCVRVYAYVYACIYWYVHACMLIFSLFLSRTPLICSLIHMFLATAENSLRERLRVPRGEQFDPVPLQLISKYVAYARKYVHPKMTPEAAAVLQDVR